MFDNWYISLDILVLDFIHSHVPGQVPKTSATEVLTRAADRSSELQWLQQLARIFAHRSK